MDTPANKFLHEPWLIGGVAGIIVIAVAVFALTTPSQASMDRSQAPAAPAEQPEASPPPAFGVPARKKREPRAIANCAECGVIELTREIKSSADARHRTAHGESAPKHYEALVRFPDGSSLTINEVNPANWRDGERVILIAGTQSPGR